MRQYAQWFIDFFNKKSGDAKIDKVANAIKALIVAYEDFWQGRAPDGIKSLQEAAQRLNELPSVSIRFDLSVSNGGIVETTPTVIKPEPEKEALSEYGDLSNALDVGGRIQNIKDWLGYYKENLPIGVCRLHSCRIFFPKGRKDHRYCTQQHANTDAVRRIRASKRQKRKKG